MHHPRLSYIYMRKDSLLQCMHEAAAQHRIPSNSPISLQSKTKLGFNFVEPLWYGRSWPRSQSESGKSNLEWTKNTFILSNYNELVDILGSEMETSCEPDQVQPGVVGTFSMKQVAFLYWSDSIKLVCAHTAVIQQKITDWGLWK